MGTNGKLMIREVDDAGNLTATYVISPAPSPRVGEEDALGNEETSRVDVVVGSSLGPAST